MSKTYGLTIEQVREAVKATLHEELQAVDVGVDLDDAAIDVGNRVFGKLCTLDDLLVLISQQNRAILKKLGVTVEQNVPLEARTLAPETPAPPVPEAEA